MKYWQKLLDPRWQRKRLEVLERDDFTCVVCTDSTKTLHVHHRKYCGDPWESPLDDLETLCDMCHRNVEKAKKEVLPLLSSAEEMIGLLGAFERHKEAANGRGFGDHMGDLIGNELDEIAWAKLHPEEREQYRRKGMTPHGRIA